MKKYLIVEFPDDDEPCIEMLPSSWVINKDTCLWPPESEAHNLKSMIMKCMPPVQDWDQIRIKILGGSNSFLKANHKVEDAARLLSSIGNYSSDSSDEDLELNQKRVKRVPFRYRSNNDNSITMNEDDDDEEHLSPITFPEDTLVPENRRSSTPMKRAKSFDFLHADSIPKESVLQKILSRFTAMEKEHKELKKEVKALREKVESKIIQTDNPEVTTAIGKIVDEEFRNLPLVNESELQALEDEVTKSSSKATSLARFLCRGSGFRDAKTLTLLIMKRLLSRNVAMLYSLEGRQKKMKFNDLNLFLVVLASVKMQFPKADNKEISKRVGTVLARSGDWDGNRIRKKRSTKSVH